jgi:hypothetical protein
LISHLKFGILIAVLSNFYITFNEIGIVITMDLEVYTPEHGLELERLINSPSWQRAINSGLVEEVRSGKIEPNKVRNFTDTVLNQLLKFNEERARKIAAEIVSFLS